MRDFFKTYELTTEILNLISSTKSYCYIVSPYIKIWPQLDRILDIASKQNTILTFIIREDIKSAELIQKLNKEYGFEVIIIKDLHIKLYLNENKCLLSTMNLYDASQHKNLELGYYVHNSKEIKKEIIEDYILADKTAVRHPGKFEDLRKELLNKVSEIKDILNEQGYCVDCQKSIDSNFNLYKPTYVRCKDCYYKPRRKNAKIKFCNFCGQTHDSTEIEPFHYECAQKLIKYNQEVKNYR